jgi:hypothetical protein
LTFLLRPFSTGGFRPTAAGASAWPAVRAGVNISYPFMPSRLYPGRWGGRAQEFSDFLGAIAALSIARTVQPKDRAMVASIIKVLNNWGDTLVRYYEAVSNGALLLQSMGLTPDSKMTKSRITVSATDLASMLTNLDLATIAISPRIFEAFEWSRAFKESLTIYCSLANLVWFDPVFGNTYSKSERKRLITDLLKTCSVWFPISEFDAWVPTLNDEFRPPSGLNTGFSRAVLTYRNLLVALQQDYGWYREMFFRTALVAPPAGFDYMTLTDGTVGGIAASRITRDEVALRKKLTPGTEIFADARYFNGVGKIKSLAVPFVRGKLIFDDPNKVPEADVPVNAIVKKLQDNERVVIDIHLRFNDNNLVFPAFQTFEGTTQFMLKGAPFMITFNPTNFVNPQKLAGRTLGSSIAWFKFKPEDEFKEYTVQRTVQAISQPAQDI